MPIRPENRRRYPKNWADISLARRKAAGWKCEICGAKQGKPNPKTGSIVTLTVAHLDHTPENCEPENLRALCQRCHLRYDGPLHAWSRRQDRNKSQADMFGGEPRPASGDLKRAGE